MQYAVRRAVNGDEEALRAVRLQALSDAPGAFGSTYEREAARTLEDWRRWLSPAATFLLEAAGSARGLAAGMRDENDPAVVHLRAMWVHPEMRGSGAAHALIAAVKGWAAEAGAREVRLMVVENNGRARRCYEHAGFRATGHLGVLERTGDIEIEMSCDASKCES